MHVITRRRLNEFADKHHESKAALAHWYGLAKRNNFSNFAGLKEIFPSADQVGELTALTSAGTRFD
jgi:mRNA interferase HigB